MYNLFVHVTQNVMLQAGYRLQKSEHDITEIMRVRDREVWNYNETSNKDSLGDWPNITSN